MTEPEDHSSTRPISVAELLAKNGSIGSPPVGGRRRRRRGDTESVTVAELTGEIPIVAESIDFDDEEDDEREVADATTNDVTGDPVEVDADEADYQAHLKRRDALADPVEFAAPAPSTPAPPSFPNPAGGAEQMSPDPVADDFDDFGGGGSDEDLIRSLQGHEPLSTADDVEPGADEVPSYLRSHSDGLFGDHDVADDRSGHVGSVGDKLADSALLRGVWAVAQSLLAVIFGAVLFVAFELLWKWNTIVGLVLAVLVILGLVAGVRVVRKTEDIGSTLIAVAVGALVTFGPLALLSTH